RGLVRRRLSGCLALLVHVGLPGRGVAGSPGQGGDDQGAGPGPAGPPEVRGRVLGRVGELGVRPAHPDRLPRPLLPGGGRHQHRLRRGRGAMKHLLLVLAGVALLPGSLVLLAWAGQQDPRLDEADCQGAVLAASVLVVAGTFALLALWKKKVV